MLMQAVAGVATTRSLPFGPPKIMPPTATRDSLMLTEKAMSLKQGWNFCTPMTFPGR